MRTIQLFAILSGSMALAMTFGVHAAETNTYYTVTVDGGTSDAPIHLDSLDVTVEKDGASAEVKPFTEVCADFASGPAIFRKRGEGWMMSSVGMAGFTGEIRIEEGAFMVNTNLMVGPIDLQTAPTVVVSNGASFVLATTEETCPSAKSHTDDGLHLMNRFSIVGEGVGGYGAVANFLGNQQSYLFYGDWELQGDATLAGTSGRRYDFSFSDGRDPAVRLNGHTLTVRRGDGSKLWSKLWSLCMGQAKVCDGNVVVDNCDLLVQGGQGGSKSSSWEGEGTLTITNKGTLSFYNNRVKIPWRVKFCDGTLLASGGTSQERYRSDVGHTNTYNYITGPIDFDGHVTFQGRYGYAGITCQREIGGKGPLEVTGTWLNLVVPNPGYLGGITVDPQTTYNNYRHPAGLALYAPGAYDANAAGVTLTDADLNLMTDERYDLPPIDFSISSGTNHSFSGGGYSNVCVSLRKDGDGRLDLTSSLSVTGRFELAGGTLRLTPLKRYYSAMPGLWKCMVPQDLTQDEAKWVYHEFMKDGNTSYSSNEVVNCCDMLKTPTYPPWEEYTSVAWGGYVWNRSPTNETWRFAVGICGYSRLYVDGTLKRASDDNGSVFFCNVEMAPGCHEFLFKVNPRKYSHPGSISAQPGNNKDWKSDTLGLALSRTSSTSTNSDDFVFMENFCPYVYEGAGGDGYLFTRDTRDVDEFDPDELDRMATKDRICAGIVCKPGTVIDLGEGNETPFIVNDFEGITSVTNGGLKIRDSWTLSPTYMEGMALSVDGTLSFGDGCALDWEDLSLLPRSSDYVLAVAKGGIDGMPAWNPKSATHSRWHLVKGKDANGSDTLTFRWQAGTVVVLR